MDTSFRVTSYQQSISGQQYNRLARNAQLRQLGWTTETLQSLGQQLQSILQRFEPMTKPRIALEIVFIKGPLGSAGEAISIDPQAKQVIVNLQAGPAVLREQLPFRLCQELAEFIMAAYLTGRQQLPRVRFDIRDDLTMIDQSERLIRSYYVHERKLEFDPKEMQTMVDQLAKIFGLRTLCNKLALHFLPRGFPPVTEIEKEIARAIQSLTTEALKVGLADNDRSLWEMTAELAMLAALAMRNGCPVLLLKCHDFLNTKPGEHLALTELLRAGAADLPVFQAQPLALQAQIRLAKSGYNVIFNSFWPIFVTYYDRMTISITDQNKV
jgi:hypothetical protein